MTIPPPTTIIQRTMVMRPTTSKLMTLPTLLLPPMWIMGITSFLDIIMGTTIMVTTDIMVIMATMGTMDTMDITAAGSQACYKKAAKRLEISTILKNVFINLRQKQ